MSDFSFSLLAGPLNRLKSALLDIEHLSYQEQLKQDFDKKRGDLAFIIGNTAILIAGLKASGDEKIFEDFVEWLKQYSHELHVKYVIRNEATAKKEADKT